MDHGPGTLPTFSRSGARSRQETLCTLRNLAASLRPTTYLEAGQGRLVGTAQVAGPSCHHGSMIWLVRRTHLLLALALMGSLACWLSWNLAMTGVRWGQVTWLVLK